MLAVTDENAELVAVLLARGADVNLQTRGDEHGDGVGVTALMLAARDGNEEIVELLLAGGADRTLRDAAGRTAADYAAQRDYLELAARLR